MASDNEKQGIQCCISCITPLSLNQNMLELLEENPKGVPPEKVR